MKIVVPYVEPLRPVVKQVLVTLLDLPVNFVAMEKDDSYFNLLAGLWAEGERFIIIEHDVLPWPGAVEELWNCPADWCSYTYKMRGYHGDYGIHHSLGCTKFGEGFMSEVPDMFLRFDSTDWKHLDAQIFHVGVKHNILPHPHRPPVIHLHNWNETNS